MSRSKEIEKMRELSNAYGRGLLDYKAYRRKRAKIIDAAQFAYNKGTDASLSQAQQKGGEVSAEEVDKLRQSLIAGSEEINVALGELLAYGDRHPEGMLAADVDLIPVVSTS